MSRRRALLSTAEQQNIAEAIRLYYDYCEDYGLYGACYRLADATTIELYNVLKGMINTHGNLINPMDFGLELYIEDDLITSAYDENNFIFLNGESGYGNLFPDGKLMKEY